MITKDLKSQHSVAATEEPKFENDKMRSTIQVNNNIDID